MSLQHVIRRNWLQKINILSRETSVEGLEFNRYYSGGQSSIDFNSNDGHIVSLIQGSGTLRVNLSEKPFNVVGPTHVYIPANAGAQLELTGRCIVIHIAASLNQARGKQLLIRNERYVRATRYVITAQYLSRRIFVHRDETLVSKNGDPVSWFRTTPFDTIGLPTNHEGKPVFKMGYDFQTEPNVVYEVFGDVFVRFAHHPYTSAEKQTWSEWLKIDEDSLYYLNETLDGNDVEWYTDPKTSERLPKRNRHEVYVSKNGYMSLMCLFDPAPTGLEQHMPGEYSSYTQVAKVVGTEQYQKFLKEVAPEDEMMDTLSRLEAEGDLKDAMKSPMWEAFESCLEKKIKQDEELYTRLKEKGAGREDVIKKWMVTHHYEHK